MRYSNKIASSIICLALLLALVILLGNRDVVDNSKKTRASMFDYLFATELFSDALDKHASAEGEVISYAISASPATITLPSGVVQNSWAYNAQVPGPEIRLSLGETLRIPFTNNLPAETTVHFHGIRVPHAMDGVPGVTQDAIEPGETFVYEFTPKEAGTFWFHPHVRGSEQVERGLYGTIVVEDSYTQSLDHDRVVVLDDWRINKAGDISEPFDHFHDVSHDGRWGNVVTANATTTQVYTVQEGERIRVRLVNASNARHYSIGTNQEVQVAAFDGMSLDKLRDYTIAEVMAPGNRMDLEWTAVSGTPLVISDDFDGYTRELIRIEVVGSTENKYQEDNYPDNIVIPEWVREEFIQAEPTHTYVLEGLGGSMMSSQWAIDGKLYGDDVSQVFPEDQAIKLRLENISRQRHPMHFHGMFFMVISRNGSPEPYGRWQDTVLVGPEESVDIVMLPQDVGEWAMHCHILEHAEAGMMTTLEIQ